MKKKFCLIFGTRPEIIKMAPFIHEAIKRKINFFVIHTGQHYSEVMDKVFWENLELPDPKYNLGVGSGSHAEQVGKMMIETEKVLQVEKPDYVCVYADLNSSIAGALTAAKMGISIVQLEAGLRSFDRAMPEEVNRLVVDRLAQYFFAPTELQHQHLLAEGISQNIFVVGNLIADVIAKNLSKALDSSAIMGYLALTPKNYFLMTTHRPAVVDKKEVFSKIFTAVGRVANEFNLPVIYPIHPRSRKNLENFSLIVPTDVRLIDPLGYFDFLTLSANAKLILSDSGGIQEEAAIMRVPLVTLRENTERQETLTLGSNILAGFEPIAILEKTQEMLERPANWQHPYGENVAKKMWDVLERAASIN
ncbi:MAG: UDP-N-acetylglucosamine 2-epimerase [Candidatus Magasanikbacteria bacterium RIFCSPLOWO2_01_FULL_43_20b]|uniref:UDP-N-acetylglucosamine 2-epimerase n=1 Tax=Candidatus Magasanikbacteria bacterium RIFCSPLOWO2_12_FULL_43_12 TaxID=1798692 RepID=A0A1F6MRM1_9BACT|nr:MAG: UDP-N-acetylglucosamine 2-epimerase [Candidatus Magasanikbacteria bacterium RIFCSPHIGHO2_02_FULL_44_13]OGH72673.1 MAG: UDP-N-acetylglucosamine 2-epimerase [Candidatus Magasanikbacteria bacterium RIFCSPLOWO2_02_FULL_43_22]OGH73270.1 MAG: UDP-N-acetylglucosamine 2-epimerase [Candidatus Magasanikbacteria bacterium RIFCSPLOWO2_01_FULL_43_20b]OGH74277.1 MAG: UDP-N-acetylglucosamine 2-epimerase [Candidatus Magasanikbacteria bacterium RIFCSPLOWO2_12_FULL_43_12]